MRKYSVMKTLKKGGEAPAAIIGLSTIIIYILKSKGVDITEEMISAIGAAITGIYGLYKAVKNYLKNKNA